MHHISILPIEVILYIFKWVVSADLDIRSLETLSEVCYFLNKLIQIKNTLFSKNYSAYVNYLSI